MCVLCCVQNCSLQKETTAQYMYTTIHTQRTVHLTSALRLQCHPAPVRFLLQPLGCNCCSSPAAMMCVRACVHACVRACVCVLRSFQPSIVTETRSTFSSATHNDPHTDNFDLARFRAAGTFSSFFNSDLRY